MTLALKRDDFEAAVGHFLGFGRGAVFNETAFSASQQRDLDEVVPVGLRTFYFPPILEGETDQHKWSFLQPVASITLESAASSIDLPSDFGGIEGFITVTDPNNANNVFQYVEITGEGQIRNLFATSPDTTGRPQWAAIRPKKSEGKTPQRSELYVWPTADQEYTLGVAYSIIPTALDGYHPYVYGGVEHHETIRESCLAAAESSINDASMIHNMKFMERLRASVAIDRRKKGNKIGYNRDLSDARHMRGLRRPDLYNRNNVTFNGVLYPGSS